MERFEKFIEGVGGGIVILFLCFWMSVMLAVWVRLHKPEEHDLFEIIKTFATGFGSSFLTMMNSRSQRKTEVTGKNAEVTVNQQSQPEDPPQKSL